MTGCGHEICREGRALDEMKNAVHTGPVDAQRAGADLALSCGADSALESFEALYGKLVWLFGGAGSAALIVRAVEKNEWEAHAATTAEADRVELALAAIRQQQAAVFEERTRLARDIHDTLAQAFTGILIQIRVALRIAADQPEEAWGLV